MSSRTEPPNSDDDKSVSPKYLLQRFWHKSRIGRIFKDLGPLRGGIILSIMVIAVLGVYPILGSRLLAVSASPDSPVEIDLTEEISQTSRVSITDLPAYILVDDSLPGITRSADLRTVFPERTRIEVLDYQVNTGDTLFGIADSFGLRPQTILWGNYSILQDNPHSLRPGQTLKILPVDGTYYEWHDGDSLETVATFFGVTVRDLVDWPGNNLAQVSNFDNPPIEPGTWLVVPGGEREFVTWSAPRITRSNPAVAKVAGPGACGSIYDGPIGEGYFIWPTVASYLSGNDYSDYHPGIDIAGGMGNAIYAAASGVVVYAGWNTYGYGYMVVLDHGDGWQTLYAHMSQVNVVCGQAAF